MHESSFPPRERRTGRRRRLSAPALLTLAALALPATAAASPPSLSDFALRPGATDLPAKVAALDAQLPKSGVQDLLDQANRTATFGSACTTPAFNALISPPDRWCFQSDDTGSIGGDDTVEWVPQGVTTVADAQDDELWGTHQALLVSWYDKQVSPEKGVRISFLDPQSGKYRHVLLVYPTTNSYGNASYEIVGPPDGIHAGGIAWYGNYLYVADTARGIRVFDMRDIFDLGAASNGNTSDGSQIGRHDGVYYGYGYRYVMPQVGAWVNDAGADYDSGFDCPSSGAPSFSYMGLDRSTTPDELITGQYCNTGDMGRVATWPLDGTSGELAPSADGDVHATSAYRLPSESDGHSDVQGAVSYGGTWYLSRSRGSTSNGELLVASPDTSPTGALQVSRRLTAGIGPEDLSYWPSRGEVWTVTEHAGRRVLYATTP